MKVKMLPHAEFMQAEGGITTVVRKYFQYLPQFGIELVHPQASDYDVEVVHAGVKQFDRKDGPSVAMLHGLYWTANEPMDRVYWKANQNIVNALRYAREITVPSAWVAKTFQRDMHINPHIVPHGINVDNWTPGRWDGYVISFAKNRVGDVCLFDAADHLHKAFPDQLFLVTHHDREITQNVRAVGVVPRDEWRQYVEGCSVVVSAAEETFGMLILEAMAAGKPVLSYAMGGALDLVEHGVNGYLATPNDEDDLARGLEYCLKYKKELGTHGREMARRWTWEEACRRLELVFQSSLHRDDNVSVIIPVHNKEGYLEETVRSALDQIRPGDEIIIVDDASTDNSPAIARGFSRADERVSVITTPGGSVARARNAGASVARNGYLLTLDGDDRILPGFVETCREALNRDNSLYIAYTGLQYKRGENIGISPWPGDYNFNNQLKGQNQVPTCAMFRREVFERVGGWRSKYCPTGAGSEDADFWLRAGALGMRGERVTAEPLFFYNWEGATTQEGYREVAWYQDKGWTSPDPRAWPSFTLRMPSNRFSNPVHKYSQPVISVVVPVGPNHREKVRDALDALEAQTFRNWEAVVVFDYDTKGCEITRFTERMFPWATFVHMSESCGAGIARNAGAHHATAGLILFHDADDELEINALSIMLDAYNRTGNAVYTDYYGVIKINKEDVRKVADDVIEYDERYRTVTTKGSFMDYNCESAIAQPQIPPYVWCPVNTLIPRLWYDEVGGFDETMRSWEDWHFFIKLARAGKCFTRVPTPLFRYNFSTGERRQLGLHIHEELVHYMNKDLEGKSIEMCDCNKNKARNPVMPQTMSGNSGNSLAMTDENMILVIYDPPGMGAHKLVGRRTRNDYGYRDKGNRFLVHAEDIKAMPHMFIEPNTGLKFRTEHGNLMVPVASAAQPQAPVVPVLREPPPPPPAVPGHPRTPLTTIKGVGDSAESLLGKLGYDHVEDLHEGVPVEMEDAGATKAQVAAVQRWLDDTHHSGN